MACFWWFGADCAKLETAFASGCGFGLVLLAKNCGVYPISRGVGLVSWTQLTVPALIGAVFVGAALPDADFMRVSRMEYDNGVVQFERTISRNQVADWSVTVVEGDGPDVCHGGGSAAYTKSEPEIQPMPLDVFVGDTCDLIPGKTYTIYAHWVPRDGGPTVSKSQTFEATE